MYIITHSTFNNFKLLTPSLLLFLQLLFITLLSTALAGDLQQATKDPLALKSLFAKFATDNARVYSSPMEAKLRLNMFRRFVKDAAKINSEQEDVNVGVTFFADMTEEEKAMYHGANMTNVEGEVDGEIVADDNDALQWGPSSTVSWKRNYGAHVLDCSGAGDCNQGGYHLRALNWIKSRNQLASSYNYRYTGRKGRCSNARSSLSIRVNSIYQARGDRNLASAIARGPVAVLLYNFHGVSVEGYQSGSLSPKLGSLKKFSSYTAFTQSLLSRYTQSGACGFFGFSADPLETFFAAAVNSTTFAAELTAAAKNVSKGSAEKPKKPHAPLWVITSGMLRRMMMEAKNAATLIAVLVIVLLWYAFYYNNFTKPRVNTCRMTAHCCVCLCTSLALYIVHNVLHAVQARHIILVEAIITVTSSDFYETSPMLRGGNRDFAQMSARMAICTKIGRKPKLLRIRYEKRGRLNFGHVIGGHQTLNAICAFPVRRMRMCHRMCHQISKIRICEWNELYIVHNVLHAVQARHIILVEAIITVTSSDFYETSPMLRGGNRGSNTAEFNSTGPNPVFTQKISPYGSFQIALIEDGDSQNRPSDKTWGSTYVRAKIEYTEDNGKKQMRFEVLNHTVLEYNLAEGGRGMELSELVKFNNELLSVDDRTGIVYAIENNMVVPKHILVDGNGHSKKGFKGEWMTVKDHYLYVGGFGKPWTSKTGEIINYDPMWVKKISPEGAIEHRYWKRRYESLMKAAGVWYPGYIYYEAVCWSDVHEKWFFLPRRLSKEAYNEKDDERMGANVLLMADELFEKIEVVHVVSQTPTHGFSSFKFLPYSNDNIIVALLSEEVDGHEAYNEKDDERMGANVLLMADELFEKIEVVHVVSQTPTHGFSSFKFLPYSNDNIIVALLSEEVDGHVQTFITAFTIKGEEIMPIKRISAQKFEGIEFLGDLTHMEHLPKWNFSLGSPIYDFQDYFTLECDTNRLSTISSPCNYPLDIGRDMLVFHLGKKMYSVLKIRTDLNKIVVHMGQVSPICHALTAVHENRDSWYILFGAATPSERTVTARQNRGDNGSSKQRLTLRGLRERERDREREREREREIEGERMKEREIERERESERVGERERGGREREREGKRDRRRGRENQRINHRINHSFQYLTLFQPFFYLINHLLLYSRLCSRHHMFANLEVSRLWERLDHARAKIARHPKFRLLSLLCFATNYNPLGRAKKRLARSERKRNTTVRGVPCSLSLSLTLSLPPPGTVDTPRTAIPQSLVIAKKLYTEIGDYATVFESYRSRQIRCTRLSECSSCDCALCVRGSRKIAREKRGRDVPKGIKGTRTDQNKLTTNQNLLFRSRDWLSANQGPVVPDSVGS
eukprot:sb/3461008/